jgi:hypothetical protein
MSDAKPKLSEIGHLKSIGCSALLATFFKIFTQSGFTVKWEYVAGHSGIAGRPIVCTVGK